MTTLNEYLDRFNRLVEYDHHKPDGGIISRPVDGADTSEWTLIGEIEYGASWRKVDSAYIFAYPYADKSDDYRRFIADNCSINLEKDGSDGGHSFFGGKYAFDSRYDKVKVYPEYENTYYDFIFNGKTQKYREEMHEKLEKELFVVGNSVVLQHDSSYKITDGVVKRGKQNPWSNNDDWGIYFWASRNVGTDPSNGGAYTYFCLVNLEQMYDATNNVENFEKNKEALMKYPYIYQKWVRGNAVACQTVRSTPIYCIRDNSNGKFYDKDWNEIEEPEFLR